LPPYPRFPNAGGPARDGSPDEVVVTHPYHPLRGRSFPFYSRLTTGGVRLVRCVQEDETLLTLPVAWTSYRAEDDFERASAGRSPWRVDDLLELRAVVDALLQRGAGHDQK